MGNQKKIERDKTGMGEVAETDPLREKETRKERETVNETETKENAP